ncbi:hypothetical protein [Staphylococcus hominis]|uniref:hypothetical protein n=1 Tax=Staphylococcus hominis TaxID=1290 RepID=UPI00066D4F24|nr:hypothetical protein [Staphylococcus hominis]
MVMYSALSSFAIAAILANNWLLFVIVLMVFILIALFRSDIIQTYISEKEKTKRYELSLRKKEQKKDRKD